MRRIEEQVQRSVDLQNSNVEMNPFALAAICTAFLAAVLWLARDLNDISDVTCWLMTVAASSLTSAALVWHRRK